MATTTLLALSFALLLDGERPGPKPGGFDRPGNGSARRSVVMARNGMVCTSQPLASQAGIALLRKGGNAFDAIVGAAAVLNVVEPMMTGIGGDMFAIAWDAKEGKLVGLNGSGRSSSRATAEAFRAKGYRTVPTHGPDSVTVPGAFHGWATLHARYGKLPLEDVLAEAVRHAEEGFPVSEVIAADWRAGVRWADVPEFREALLVREADSEGRATWRAPRAGEVFRAPDLGRTLRALGKGGIGEFYKGDVARRIAEHLRSRGSSIDLDDLAKHESTWVEPMSATFRGYTLHELPPNGQGLAALQMLNMLEQYDLEALGHNSAPYIHLLLESKKLAFADRDRWVADPSFRELPLATLVSKEYAGKMRARIDPARAGSFPRSTLDLAAETTYLCAADRDGNAVSFINSLFHGFGSGLVVPGTGICLQNRGSLFSLEEGHLNRLEPSKRPLHTIIPAFVTRDGKPWLCYGVMGGDMQPQGHVQVFLNMVVFGMNPQEAGEAPRVRETGGGAALESGIAPDVVEALKALGHRIDSSPGGFGGFQGILIDGATGVLRGATESRKDGCAAGY